MRKKYEVWLSRMVFETNDKAAAEEHAYLEMADEPAPDKHDYMKVKIKVREDVEE